MYTIRDERDQTLLNVTSNREAAGGRGRCSRQKSRVMILWGADDATTWLMGPFWRLQSVPYREEQTGRPFYV